MSVIVISGIPGAGKTLIATKLALKKFKKENRFRKLRRKPIFNNVFSNYPICLKKNIFTNKVYKEDFTTYKKWLMDSDIIFDEFQAIFGDSTSWKQFPDVTAKNFQFHRHFGINNIYLISQHPSRIMKIPRDIACEYWKINRFISFLGVGFIKYTIYYQVEDYGKYIKKKEESDFDYKKKFMLFFTKPVFKAYDTKYLAALVKDKPLIEQVEYNTKSMTLEDMQKSFNIYDHQ